MWKGLTAEHTVYPSPKRYYLKSIVRCLGAGGCWSDSAGAAVVFAPAVADPDRITVHTSCPGANST